MDTKITLNEKQISDFILRKSLKIDDNRYLELFGDDIMINVNGIGYHPYSMNMEYYERFHERALPVERLQMQICEHFNFEPYNVIFTEGYGLELKFFIKFGADNLREMLVCDFETAIKITEEINDIAEINSIRKNLPMYIGSLRRLNHSCYYFMWLDEV